MFSIRSVLLATLLSVTSFSTLSATASSIQDYDRAMSLLQTSFDIQDNDIRYLLERSAEAENTDAIQQLAIDYGEGLSGEQSDAKALFWLHRYGELVSQDGGYLFAQYVENHSDRLTAQEIASGIYEAASLESEQAADAYSRILENEFNAKRSKQLSNLQSLEVAAQPEPLSTNKIHDESGSTVPLWMLLLSLASTLVLGVAWLLTNKRKNPQAPKPTQNDQQMVKLNRALAEQKKENLLMKRQLEKLFKELKRRQESEPNQKLQVACAMFGVTPTTIPAEKELKRRYRQLSKLYHPDALGSDEEMKRLNISFKTLTLPNM